MSFGKLYSSISIGIGRYFFQKDHSTFRDYELFAMYWPTSLDEGKWYTFPEVPDNAREWDHQATSQLCSLTLWLQKNGCKSFFLGTTWSNKPFFFPLTLLHHHFPYSFYCSSLSMSRKNNPASWVMCPTDWLSKEAFNKPTLSLQSALSH